MLAYWRKIDRVERQQRRQQERQAEERHKMDVQLLEAKRQQRKLNFLITQTELYAHFIAKKDSNEQKDEEKAILAKLDEGEKSGRLAEIDHYDSRAAQLMARNNASQVKKKPYVFFPLFFCTTYNKGCTGLYT